MMEQPSGDQKTMDQDGALKQDPNGKVGPLANGEVEKSGAESAIGSETQRIDHQGGDSRNLNNNNNNNNNIDDAANVISGSDKGTLKKKSVSWSEELVMESSSPTKSVPSVVSFNGSNSNHYVHSSPDEPSYSASLKDTMVNVRDVLGRWGKKVGEATKKAEDLAGNTWQHLKTAPSFTDAAMGRIAQGTKVLAEGGYEKIFRQTFETVPEELLQNSYACYLSTSAGPVMGVLYVSTAKVAFCSDNPLSYKAGEKTEWSYYKVIIPLHQLKAINPSTSRGNPTEKYIQVISVDNHEFWYMGFLNYEGAVTCLQVALQVGSLQSV